MIKIMQHLRHGLYGDVVGIPNFVQASKGCSRFVDSSFNICQSALASLIILPRYSKQFTSSRINKG